ncbi:putative bifunctional diguanylate cyclase/phosphodiesterase [Modestobacter sp. URMC 112]
MFRQLRDHADRLLPHGRRLPEQLWQRRHSAIVRLAFAAGVAVVALAWARGLGQPTAVAVLATVAGPLVPAMVPALGRTARAAATTLSLLAASVALVHLWSGVTEAHFVFFVVVGVVSLYQHWVPFGIALVVVAGHHGVVGSLYPDVVVGQDTAHEAWWWAVVHAAFVLAASAAHLASWRLNEDQVLSDPLTGLANRTLLEETAERALRRGPVSVLFVDLDDFKDVNDSRGHAVGDELLLVLAERLKSCVRPADLVARMGGDEFAVLVAAGPDVAHAVAERVLTSLAVPILLDGGGPVVVHGSIGVASCTDAGSADAGTLLRDADLAMYLAKAQGGNRLVVYAGDMGEAAQRRVELQQDLALATAAGQLEVHYQPTVLLADGRTTGFEALVRWHHPQLGTVSPAEFIPLAEESGAIIEIGRWVLRQALHQAAAWSTEVDGPLRMAVNLSPRQLMDDDVTRDVVAALADSGFPARQLTLEVTEGVLVQDVERVVAQLAELRALGVAIAIDDFGTGFSGLSYLRRLPADIIKIDRSFVSDLAAGSSSASLISSIVELARTLGLAVVAEGVETDGQRRLLQDLHCGSAQGFLFARPEPAAGAAAHLPQGVPLG